MVFQESKILKFLGLCGIHSREPGSVVFLSAIEIRGDVSWPEVNLRRREPVRSGSEGNEMPEDCEPTASEKRTLCGSPEMGTQRQASSPRKKREVEEAEEEVFEVEEPILS
ncbi:hypothetical protein YC2023_042879 [Brassica napus]